MHDAIDLDTKLILGVKPFGRHGKDPMVAFLNMLTEQHGLSDAEVLADQFGYGTVLAQLELSGWVDYTHRNLIKTWFHEFKVRVNRFHNS